MWKRTDDGPETTGYTPQQPQQPAAATPPRSSGAEPRRGSATIGPSIRIKGDLSGEEDLVVEGKVDGKIELRQNAVTVGRSGRVRADIYGSTISVEGEVEGNLFADEQILVRASGKVLGNLTAPRVSLEDGAKFKGSIDMEPKQATTTPISAGRPGPGQVQPGERPGAERPGGSSESGSSSTAGDSASGRSSSEPARAGAKGGS
jgi:cytoskeletal protein CcmA (bactofilin family)